MYSFYPSTTYSSRRQHRPVYTSYAPSIQTSINPTIEQDYSLDDSSDEEELLLRAALERKQRQRLARQQHRQQQQQLEQQFLIEQQRQIEQQRYEALLKKERARQLVIAQAQAQYEAEQEAISRYKRAQLAKEKQQRQQDSLLEALVFQGIHQAQQEREQEQEDFHVRTRKIKASATTEAKKQAAARTSTTNDESDEETEEELNPLEALMEALFFPQLKRSQPQEESYPCKRRHQQRLFQQQRAQEQEKSNKERVRQEAESEKVQQKVAQQQQEHKQKQASTPQNDVYDALPVILSFVEAIFGGEDEARSQSCGRANNTGESSNCRSKTNGFCKKDAADVKTTQSAGATPSSSDSSPELQAANILRQRQQQYQEQTRTLQQKHSELNLVESALDSFSLDLTEALEGAVTEEKKKVVLSAEDNVSKAMFRIDSVQSDGNLSVRQRRKELIKKSQDMLDLVDKYKNLESNTGKKVDRNVDIEASSSEDLSESDAEVVDLEVEAEPADIVESLPETESSARDQDKEIEDGNEIVEPYNVAVVASSPSVTVQDESEQSSSEPATSAVELESQVEQTTAVADDERIEGEEETHEEPEVAEVESAHDDYEIVSEF